MSRNAELADVIRLACLTESRTNAEQRALIALAWDCDRAHNKLTATNRARLDPDWRPQDLVSLVIATRVEEDGDKTMPPPKRWEQQWATWERESARQEVVA